MKEIYIITGGEYSDYHIVGAYSTKEKAKKELAKKKLNMGSYWSDMLSIETYSLDDEEIVPRYTAYTIYTDKNYVIQSLKQELETTPYQIEDQMIRSKNGEPNWGFALTILVQTRLEDPKGMEKAAMEKAAKVLARRIL
jgi:hypothetical protein